jgi:hypothetical protein
MKKVLTSLATSGFAGVNSTSYNDKIAEMINSCNIEATVVGLSSTAFDFAHENGFSPSKQSVRLIIAKHLVE